MGNAHTCILAEHVILKKFDEHVSDMIAVTVVCTNYIFSQVQSPINLTKR